MGTPTPPNTSYCDFACGGYRNSWIYTVGVQKNAQDGGMEKHTVWIEKYTEREGREMRWGEDGGERNAQGADREAHSFRDGQTDKETHR